MKWRCASCDYVYDSAAGDSEVEIPAGVELGDLPEDWKCPICGCSKDKFEEEGG